MPELENTRYRRLWRPAGFTTLTELHPSGIRQQPPKDYANVNYLGVTWSYHPRWNEGLVQWTTKDPQNWGDDSGVATWRNYHTSCEQGSNKFPSRNIKQRPVTVIWARPETLLHHLDILTRAAPRSFLKPSFTPPNICDNKPNEEGYIMKIKSHNRIS